MRNANFAPGLILAGSLAVGCALPLSATAASIDQALSQAEAAIGEAKANNWIWRDTEKFFNEAQAAAHKGDKDKALKLANKAREQAEDALKQYQLEKEKDRSI